MSFPSSKSAKLSQEAAEHIGALALAFLAAEPQRLVAFMEASGLDIADIKRGAGSRDFLSAVLDHMTRDESLLLVFAAENALHPEQVMRASHVLSGDMTS